MFLKMLPEKFTCEGVACGPGIGLVASQSDDRESA